MWKEAKRDQTSNGFDTVTNKQREEGVGEGVV
jgi:hypothetical protein